jgi:puromycin-sensitive aminopeptidase
VATRVLSFFGDYFDIPYPLPKIDLIAIPDFAAGAMENWGAVTYRETAILVDPEKSSAATKQRVAIVIAHELAHQWFGNLVTMEWWTHLWLNEGFASWIEYLAVDHLFPEWDIWTQFVFSDFARALSLDGLKHSHPIEVEVRDPSEIHEIFDAISYSKGASIIRMLAAFLGEEVFRRGLHLYLTRHQYGNATTNDLWNALAEASGKPVERIMDSWTKQTGYPVISLNESREGGSDSFTLQQSRFLSSGTDPAGGGDPSQWWIPIGIISASSPEPTFAIIQDRSTTLMLPVRDNEWIKLNATQSGFYRVNYPPALWAKLLPAIESVALPAPDRLGVESDAFALARAGLLPTTRVLALVEAYRNESNYTVWADLSTNLEEFSLLWSHEPGHEQFRAFARDLYCSVMERLGWEVQPGEAHLTALLRSLVISVFGHYGDVTTMDEAGRRFAQFVKDGHSLHPDLRFPVYSLVVENGNSSAYEAVLKIFREADLHEEKVRCLRALGYSQQPDLLQRTLEFSLSAEVRSQDTVFVIASVALNRYGREMAWQFLQDRWDEFDRRYGKGGFLLARLISSTTENFTTEDRAQEVEAFFGSHPVPAAERAIQQSLERIRSNTGWLERDREPVRQWLQNRSKKGSGLHA